MNIFFLFLIIYLIIINRYYEKELDLFDFIKLYEIGENDLITSEINIRKEDGQSCKIITEFPDSNQIKEHQKAIHDLNKLNDENKIDEKEYEIEIKRLGNPKLIKNIIKRGDCL